MESVWQRGALAKGGRLGEQLQRLPVHMFWNGQRCADDSHEILSGRLPPCRRWEHGGLASAGGHRVAIEFFSGSGHLARILRRHGWFVIEIDIVRGLDILMKGRPSWLRGVLTGGLIGIVHFGILCFFFSGHETGPTGHFSSAPTRWCSAYQA